MTLVLETRIRQLSGITSRTTSNRESNVAKGDFA